MLNLPHIINIISGSIFIFSFVLILILSLVRWRIIFTNFKKIPLFLLAIHSTLFLFGVIFIPKIFSGEGDFGIFMLQESNIHSWSELLFGRAPVFFLRTKVVGEVLDGVSFNFMSNLTFVGFFISSLLIYVTVKNITKNNNSALLSSVFFATCPIIFFLHLTENYTLLALFFVILSLFFISIWANSQDKIFLILSFAASVLAAGSRIEYIFFPYILIFFYFLFSKEKSYLQHIKCLLPFLLLLIPRTLWVGSSYFYDATHDIALHGKIYEKEEGVFNFIVNVISGASSSFISNAHDTVINMINPLGLIGFFFFLSLLSLILIICKRNNNKNPRRLIFFFFVYFSFLFFFYNYFHATLGTSAIRHFVGVIFPLPIISGILVGSYLKKDVFAYALSLGIILYLFIFILIPFSFDYKERVVLDENLKRHIMYETKGHREEYFKYNNLTYENRFFRIFHSNENADVKKGDNTYFISNGHMNYIHTMPVSGFFVPLYRDHYKEQLRDVENRLTENDIIYAIQSGVGFTVIGPDYYKEMVLPPDQFMSEMKDRFKLKEKIISYEVKQNDDSKHPIFLYKMKKK